METKAFVQRCRNYACHIELPVYLLLKGSYIYNNLDEFNIAPINYNGNWQLEWETKDGKNTYPLRVARMKELANS